MEGNTNTVVLLDFWPSSYGMRVRVALAEKGIQYESKEENLMRDKSTLLLEMNPVHKSIPVLIHNGKPVNESMVIVEYIDEVWHDKSPLLSSDPYERSQARFWADYVDKKVFNIAMKVWKVKGEEQEVLMKELIENLKTLEGQLGDKLYFGGENLGLVDVIFVPVSSWFSTVEAFGDFSIEAECPKLISWVRRCLERDSISKSLPDPEKIYGFALQLKQKRGI